VCVWGEGGGAILWSFFSAQLVKMLINISQGSLQYRSGGEHLDWAERFLFSCISSC